MTTAASKFNSQPCPVRSLANATRLAIVDNSVPLAKMPAIIEASGATWKGYVHTIAPDEVTVICKGFPPITVDQRAVVRWESSTGTIEFDATVEKMMRPSEADMRFVVTFGFREVDEFTRYRLRRVLNQERVLVREAVLRVIVQPVEQCEALRKIGGERIRQAVEATLSRETSCQSFPRRKPIPAEVFLSSRLDTNTVSQGLPSPNVSVSTANAKSHSSRHIVIANRYGDRIRGFWEPARQPIGKKAPVIILAPAYGETKRDLLTLAYYLAANGMHAIRYDHTNHVGESDGAHVRTTLPRMHDDLQDVCQWARRQFPAHPIGIVATSLAARVAIKALGDPCHRVDLLVVLNPIADMRQTLYAIHREDLLGEYLDGKPRGITNILGFNVDGQPWLMTAHEHGYTDLATTIDDARHVAGPVVMFSSEHDPWVEQDAVASVAATLGSRLQSWFVIPHGHHRFVENPRLARLVYRQVVQQCRGLLQNVPETAPLREPDRRRLGKQKRIERIRRRPETIQADLPQFWSEYLAHFGFIRNSPDYQQLLDHILHMLDSLKPGSRILDAGCGNGILAAFMFSHPHWGNQLPDIPQSSLTYVGIDFVGSALTRAQSGVRTLLDRHADPDGESRQQGRSSAWFLQADLNRPLPFPDHTFDAVVSNLVLGYLPNPSDMIRECLRVLAPGGTMVVTNLKPNADLSRIYCNFVERTHKQEDIVEARHLLSNAGKIREAEGDGIFQFPDEEELGTLFQSASGGLHVRIFPTFANQAYIVVLRKPGAATTHLRDRTFCQDHAA